MNIRHTAKRLIQRYCDTINSQDNQFTYGRVLIDLHADTERFFSRKWERRHAKQ